MEKVKTVTMRFKREDNKIYAVSIKNPKDDVTEQEIKTVMDLIVAKNIINPKGVKLVSTHDAKLINTESEVLDLVI